MKGNNVSITGNLTRDCEVRQTQSGSIVLSWGLCWNSSRKNQQGGYDDIPHYFDVQAWVTDAQCRIIQQQLVKGARCSITEAHLIFQQWQDQQGNNRSKVLVQVDDVIQGMTVRQPQNSQAASQAQYQGQSNNHYPSQQNGGYNAPQQPQNNGYQQQNGYQGGYQPAIDANTSVYDDDIPF